MILSRARGSRRRISRVVSTGLHHVKGILLASSPDNRGRGFGRFPDSVTQEYQEKGLIQAISHLVQHKRGWPWPPPCWVFEAGKYRKLRAFAPVGEHQADVSASD